MIRKTILSPCEKCGVLRTISIYSKSVVCRSCSKRGIKASEDAVRKNSECRLGSKNHFYGRHHTEDSKSKMGKYQRTEKQKEQSREALKKVSNRRLVFDIWVEKFGIEEANQKLAEKNRSLSIFTTGKNNGMYGRSPGVGSGNGWSGWYCGVYFRSILEMSYIHRMVCEGVVFETAEKKKYAIQYIFDGTQRNYFSDFYLPDRDLFVEVKPSKLLETHQNTAKFSAAKRLLGDRFRVVTENDFSCVVDNDILLLYNSGKIVWVDRFMEKFREKYA